MVSLPQLYESMCSAGFYLFDGARELSLESLALKLGHPVSSGPHRPLVDVLVPKGRVDSLPGSLSSLHGVNAFPFHTETAHWRRSVDWVILKCVNPGAGDRPTMLIDAWDLGLEEDEVTHLTKSLMVVKNGAKSFLAPLVTKERERLSFRYDVACMRPTSDIDRTALNVIEKRLGGARPTEIRWKPGQCLVFDNRRVLHSRADSTIADPDRRLHRIYTIRSGS